MKILDQKQGRLCVILCSNPAQLQDLFGDLSAFCDAFPFRPRTKRKITGMNAPRSLVQTFLVTYPNHPLIGFYQSLLFRHAFAYYFIAYVVGDDITYRHELCHWYYHISASYRRYWNGMWHQLSPGLQKWFLSWLQKQGYGSRVMVDEFQAYLRTEPRQTWFTNMPPIYQKEFKFVLQEVLCTFELMFTPRS